MWFKTQSEKTWVHVKFHLSNSDDVWAKIYPKLGQPSISCREDSPPVILVSWTDRADWVPTVTSSSPISVINSHLSLSVNGLNWLVFLISAHNSTCKTVTTRSLNDHCNTGISFNVKTQKSICNYVRGIGLQLVSTVIGSDPVPGVAIKIVNFEETCLNLYLSYEGQKITLQPGLATTDTGSLIWIDYKMKFCFPTIYSLQWLRYWHKLLLNTIWTYLHYCLLSQQNWWVLWIWAHV